MCFNRLNGKCQINLDRISGCYRFPVFAIVFLFCSPGFTAEQVKVDLTQPLTVSNFEIGCTHTHYRWENGHPTAADRAKNLLIDGCVDFQNQHIMGWGATNPEPSPGIYNWTDLDHRINDVILPMPNSIPVITFCSAPGWMKTTGEDWNLEDRVADDHVDDFADLCRRIAQRYPDVEYFQVWNEMKGYWNLAFNNWDWIRYTTLYNAVYDAVKSVRPDARLGGPYLVVQGDGAVTIGRSGTHTYTPISTNDWYVINYWLANKHGADFFCFDYSLIDYHDNNSYTNAEMMQLTHFWGDVVAQLRAETNLPIWISEFYGGINASDPDFTAANHASCYYHCLINGANLGLVWNPEEGEIGNHLFTDTATSTGGEPTPHYHVAKAFNDYFSPGTQVYTTNVSTSDIEALASLDKTLLINKSSSSVIITLDHNDIALDGYEVKVVDTRTGVVDFEDLSVFCYYWMDNSCTVPDYCAGYDYDYSGTVDIPDLARFALSWLQEIN